MMIILLHNIEACNFYVSLKTSLEVFSWNHVSGFFLNIQFDCARLSFLCFFLGIRIESNVYMHAWCNQPTKENIQQYE